MTLPKIRYRCRWLSLASAICLLVTFNPIPTAASAQDETKSLALLVKAIENSDDPKVQASLMRGMLRGLEGRRIVQRPARWESLSAKLADSSDGKVKDLANQLSQIFGDEAAIETSLATLKNKSAAANERQKALRSLLAMRNKETSWLLESLLDEPGLKLDAIRGYSVIENPGAATVLLQRYSSLDAAHQRAVVETLSSRKRYAQALLKAIKSNQVPREDIPIHVARAMKELLGFRFVEFYGEIKPIGDDREKQIKKYKNILTEQAIKKGNASKGRAVFKKTCASCHLLYGEGGKVGPDLTGSNRANLDYILLNSIDPSYDVPDGYKMVTVLTDDGRLINGVLAEEDATKIVLKTAEVPRVVIAKEDIEERKASTKSIMPDGQLDEMKTQEVVDLIKYLRTTEQVELAK